MSTLTCAVLNRVQQYPTFAQAKRALPSEDLPARCTTYGPKPTLSDAVRQHRARYAVLGMVLSEHFRTVVQYGYTATLNTHLKLVLHFQKQVQDMTGLASSNWPCFTKSVINMWWYRHNSSSNGEKKKKALFRATQMFPQRLALHHETYLHRYYN